jgi:hypothetical protein
MEKILIILTDDWELRGRGFGNVMDMQYKTAIELMNLYNRFGIKSTFYIEVMQQMAFERYKNKYKNIKEQVYIWKEAVSIMLSEGFDIQLHIHPQWHNGYYDGRDWKLDNRWSITSYGSNQINSFIEDSMKYIYSEFSGIKPVAFRAGAWGACCPSRVLFESLEKNGIKVDTSILNGRISKDKFINVNYTDVESPYFPYYPDYDDIRKVSNKKAGIVEIPTQSIRDSWIFKSRKALKKIKSFKSNNVQEKDYSSLSKIKKVKIDSLKSPCIAMDLSILDEYALIIGFDIIIKRALRAGYLKTIPLIITNHTKDLTKKKLKYIEKALNYIQSKYNNITNFTTLGEIVKHIDIIQPIIKSTR